MKECKSCGWMGDDDELVDDDNTDKFDQCPRCGSKELDNDESD